MTYEGLKGEWVTPEYEEWVGSEEQIEEANAEYIATINDPVYQEEIERGYR